MEFTIKWIESLKVWYVWYNPRCEPLVIKTLNDFADAVADLGYAMPS